MEGGDAGASTLRRVSLDAPIGVERGGAAVCIPVYGQHALFERCLSSVLEHTPDDVPVLVADDASPDRETERYLESARPPGRCRGPSSTTCARSGTSASSGT